MKYSNQKRIKTSNKHSIVVELASTKQGITDI